MSLTSFLDEKDVKAKFREQFPSVHFELPDRPVVSPLSKNYSLMGTAFEYLLRFRLQQHYSHAKESGWFAEDLAIFLEYGQGMMIEDRQTIEDRIREIIDQAGMELFRYLQTGHITTELLQSAWLLAQTEFLHRVGQLWKTHGIVDERDMEDLRQLIQIVPIDQFKSQSVCLLGPRVGPARNALMSARADLILDNCIIEIKTVRKFQVKRDYLNQLLGYYTLSRLDGVTGMPDGHIIDTLGIYFARHGYLLTFPVSQYVQEATFADFMEWFQQRAYKGKGTTQ